MEFIRWEDKDRSAARAIFGSVSGTMMIIGQADVEASFWHGIGVEEGTINPRKVPTPPLTLEQAKAALKASGLNYG